MVSNNDVRKMVSSYLESYPNEWCQLQRLSWLLADAIDVTDRQEDRGHLTASAVVVNKAGLILLVEQWASGTWGLPGGHLEPGDATVADAAVRVISTQVGVPAEAISLLMPDPVQIYAHMVPMRPSGHVQHYHFDVRFLCHVSAEVGALRTEEVGAAGWFPGMRLPDDVCARVLDLTAAA